MAGFFEYLQDIIFSIFIRDPQELERRRRLRALYAEVKQYFRYSTLQVLPAFAETILRLASLLRPLRDIFARSISNVDLRLAQRYKDYLAVSRLPENLQDRHLALSYSTLKARVLEAATPERELLQIDREVEELLATLSGAAFQGFDHSYTAMDRLAALAGHDFRPLLRAFDPNLRTLDGSTPPAFQPVAGEEIIHELLDFYFILAGLELSNGVRSHLEHLLDRLTREHSEAAKERMNRVYQLLQSLLSEKLQHETILALIRLIQKDPRYVPQTIREESSFLEAFKNRLQIGYQRSKERIQGLLREQSVKQDLEKLFAGMEMLPIDGYREEIDQALQDRDYDGFSQIRPLRILKSYIRLRFQRELKEGLKRLIVEGKFENKVFQNMFTNTFFQCEGMGGKIGGFEDMLQGEGTQSMKKLGKYLELLDQGKPVHNMINTVLEAIDKESRDLVHEGSNCYYNLCVILLEILNDARQKTPTHISNIKILAGRKAQEYLSNLSFGYNNLYQFARIMKNFTTIKQMAIDGSGS